MNNAVAVDILKKARKKNGYSQETLGTAIGLSELMIQRYEEGAFPIYKGDKIKEIDKLLNTNIYDILYDKNYVAPKKVNLDNQVENNTIKIKIPYVLRLTSLYKRRHQKSAGK